jgi:multidrug efflux system membrane fusion protein
MSDLPDRKPTPAQTAHSVSDRPQRRWTLITIAVVGLALLGGTWWFNHRPAAAAGPGGGGGGGRRGGGGFGFGGGGPLPVATVVAAKGDISLYLNALGTVTPLRTVTVRTQISGQLVQLGFKEGQMVKQGDTLAVIDPRPYENALAQAEGQLAQAQAQLHTAQLDLQRYETLAKEDSISKQQVDTAQSQLNQYLGLVQADQAAIDTVKLNLTYCHIKAPVDGRVGLRLVDVGNYITPSDTGGIVVLTQVKPISVIFTLPEDNINIVSARLHAGAKLPAQALDRTQSRELAAGLLSTIDNQIDTSTGTFRLRAEFANDDETLFPNQFVNIRLLVDTQHDVISLPTSAIERGQQGTFVYVVQPDDSAGVVPVTLGPIEGERVAISSGLNVGDRVVIDGADKLRDGMKVILTDSPAAGRGGRGGRGGGAGGGEKKWRGGGEDGGKKSRPKTDGTP